MGERCVVGGWEVVVETDEHLIILNNWSFKLIA